MSFSGDKKKGHRHSQSTRPDRSSHDGHDACSCYTFHGSQGDQEEYEEMHIKTNSEATKSDLDDDTTKKSKEESYKG